MTKQTVRTTVEPDVFAHLQYLADEAGVSLFVLARDVLTDYAVEHTDTSPPEVSPEQWSELREWVRVDLGRLNGYPGPRKWSDPLNRARVYAWAIKERGFNPTK